MPSSPERRRTSSIAEALKNPLPPAPQGQLQVQFLTQLQQAGGVDPDTFITSNNKLSEQLRRLKQEKARLLDTDSDDLADRTRDLMDELEDGPDFLDSFDAELFDALVEKIIVDSNERLRFRLKNGLELTEQIERTRR